MFQQELRTKVRSTTLLISMTIFLITLDALHKLEVYSVFFNDDYPQSLESHYPVPAKQVL